MSYAEVGARSNFSLLDGASHPEEMAARAHALGHVGIGICDTNTLAGVVRGHVAAKGLSLRFIVGSRLILSGGQEYLVWPTSRLGYGRLARLLSIGKMCAHKGEFDVGRAELLEHAQDWAIAMVPRGETDAALVHRLKADAADFHGRLALPLMVAGASPRLGADRHRLEVLVGLASAAGARLLATNDVRFHDPGRRRLADLLSAVRHGTTVSNLGFRAEPNSERHLKSPREMARLFEGHPDALAASLDVLEAGSGFSLDELRHEYPDEILDPGLTPQQTLERRVAVAVAERWPEGAPHGIPARLQHELRLIGQLEYAPYFLTVDEVVRFARRRGILCQGRGSAANSAICYVLGITAVDPSKHDLLFERFVSASRAEPPDIDVDFEHERREEVIQHIYETYGRDRAAIVATVIRYRSKSAIREVGKALGLTENTTKRLAGAMESMEDQGFGEALQAAGLDASDHLLRLAVELYDEIQNFPRHLATHTGGFVITRGPLIETAVVGNAAMAGRTVMEWDKDDIDALGLLKVDILALGMLSCLRRGFELLQRHHRLAHDLASIPRECPDVYAMLRRADTLGVFQIESRAQMNMLPRLRPTNFYDIVVQIAIIRPGPIQGDMVHPYLRRRWGLEEPVYPAPHPDFGPADELERVLKKTLGVPLFQEQAMRIAIVAAKFTPDEADQLRRAMATFKFTQGVGQYREKLVGGMTRRGYPLELAERVFKQIEGFGSYGFPESHAASFAHLAYASSWLKCHHPAVFACALLNSQPMGFYAPAQIVRDARDHGVLVDPIDVNHSDWDCSLQHAPASTERLALRLGLRLVAHLATEDGKAIAKARRSGNGAPFASVEEVARRSGVGRPALEALAAADAFCSMGSARREASWDATAIESRGADPGPLFTTAAGDAPLLPEPAPALPPEHEGEAVIIDYQAAGMTLRQHPLKLLRPILGRLGMADTRRMERIRDGGKVRLPGLVLMRQRPGTAKGIVFITVEDEHGQANIVVFKDVGERDRTAMRAARLLVVEGVVERQTEHAEVPITHVIARRLIDRSDLLDSLWTAGEDTEEASAGAERPRPSLGSSRDFR
ncbi:DNA polymerase III subunit alpha [Roseococcus sp. SYP-B2431]|uniref:error-prone DNA polymerase n=1 Tax=Roseococcus sp. SYP-B2431 TaxID=2496640 RepID=UPI00103B9112|nr:error-prone DNA polymerase [Roseococcus sp. SYP-B2431]TCI00778.1 DNA polymerase III subunit alpha [Roseococcus sp. SYP-B2431]